MITRTSNHLILNKATTDRSRIPHSTTTKAVRRHRGSIFCRIYPSWGMHNYTHAHPQILHANIPKKLLLFSLGRCKQLSQLEGRLCKEMDKVVEEGIGKCSRSSAPEFECSLGSKMKWTLFLTHTSRVTERGFTFQGQSGPTGKTYPALPELDWYHNSYSSPYSGALVGCHRNLQELSIPSTYEIQEAARFSQVNTEKSGT